MIRINSPPSTHNIHQKDQNKNNANIVSNQQQLHNKTIKLTLPSRIKTKQKRIQRQDDPLMTYSPINQLRKPPTYFFIKYFDVEISTQDFNSQSASENRLPNFKDKSTAQENKFKKTKNAILNILQRFLQNKIKKNNSKLQSILIINYPQLIQIQIKLMILVIISSKFIKKLKQFQILFSPKDKLQKSKVYKQKLPQIIVNQEKFHQIGKELIINLQSPKNQQLPQYTYRNEKIISKNVQLYKYLHNRQRKIQISNSKQTENEKAVVVRQKGIQRKIATKNCLKIQKTLYDNPYQIDEPYSQESILQTDQQSYNLSYLRIQDSQFYDQTNLNLLNIKKRKSNLKIVQLFININKTQNQIKFQKQFLNQTEIKDSCNQFINQFLYHPTFDLVSFCFFYLQYYKFLQFKLIYLKQIKFIPSLILE
ncbi:unnamed protein product [Paramecium sonneborni]|uniref:Uncharacterized protein n=1 Tax=Paramecium sonneborni TaxID=65129 RepID=A0A8S1RU51_9CILI|nr:unnamed protein product [Paramecium sonneborni]